MRREVPNAIRTQEDANGAGWGTSLGKGMEAFLTGTCGQKLGGLGVFWAEGTAFANGRRKEISLLNETASVSPLEM